MLFVDFNDNFSCKENLKNAQRSWMLGFFFRPLCHDFAALDANDIRHRPHLELRYRHGDLSAPLHKEVKTIINWGMWRVSVMPMGRLHGEIVGLVHASRRLRDVKYETCSLSRCVFSTAFN